MARSISEKRAATQRWRENNPEKVRAYSKQYYLDNIEKIKAKPPQKRNRQSRQRANELIRISYAIDPTAIKNRTKAWIAKNPEKKRAQTRNRRSRLRMAGGKHTGEEVLALFRRQKRRCANPACRVSIRDGYEGDHIIPLSLGGTNDISNIQLLCMPCNRKKHAKHPIEW